MITFLIIDDEYIAHDIIKGYCDLLPNMKLMKHCYDALEAFEYLSSNQVDLIFLDLNMPKLKGFEFLKILPNPPKVIVTTAYKEHALEGFEHNVADYLLKPFSFERFLKAVNNATSVTEKAPVKSVEASDNSTKSIFLRSNKKHIQVVLDTVQYIEAAGNYTKIITTAETVTIREKVSDVVALLPETEFLQVHKSFAVAINHIKSIEGNRILVGDHIIPIGKYYKANVNDLLS